MSRDDFSDLKSGDEIAIDKPRYGSREFEIARVDKITPSGRIVIGGAQFNPDGSERGGNKWYRFRLVRLTPELRQEILDAKERDRLLTKIGAARFRDLPLEKLRAIVELLA